jgi:hypothetical protein
MVYIGEKEGMVAPGMSGTCSSAQLVVASLTFLSTSKIMAKC